MSVSVVFCSFALYTDRRISLFQRYVMFMTDRKGSRWMMLLVQLWTLDLSESSDWGGKERGEFPTFLLSVMRVIRHLKIKRPLSKQLKVAVPKGLFHNTNVRLRF